MSWQRMEIDLVWNAQTIAIQSQVDFSTFLADKEAEKEGTLTAIYMFIGLYMLYILLQYIFSSTLWKKEWPSPKK